MDHMVANPGPALEFGVLGPVEVTAGGVPVPVGGSKPLIVLAGLLLRANRVVGVEELSWWLWDSDESRWSKGALQTYVLRVRRALGEHARLRTERGGYLLEVDPEALDLGRFRAAADRGRQAAERGELRDAAAAFTEALAQWRGPALSNVESDALLRDEVGQLDDERLGVREQWAEVMLGLGEHHAVVPRLMALARENPLRERLHEQLMLALHRSGRQADALAVYRSISTALAEELGLDPGPSLRRAYQAVLAGERGTHTRHRGETLIPRQLPGDFAGFTGRQDALGRLRELVRTESAPIASIEGMGGVGKTTLAVHFAHEVAGQYPGGQFYTDLRGYGPGSPLEPLAALEMMLTALGVPADDLPAGLAERAALWRTHTASRRVLVVLDNAGSTEQVRPLLPGPGCLVLVTSRSRLRSMAAVHGARRIPLEELPVADAVELLAGIVGKAAVRADPIAAREFVARCGRLPLAIRILAVRASQFPEVTVADFVEEFDREQDKLGSFDLNDGEETDLRAVFARSYHALDGASARMLRLLGLPEEEADFTAASAAALAGVGLRDARMALDRLSSAHLIAEPRPGRYQFHDLIREFAADLCRRTESETARREALDRLLSWAIDSTLEAARRLRPGRRYELIPRRGLVPHETFPDRTTALTWHDAEAANLGALVRLANRIGAHDRAWQLAWVLQSYFMVRTRLHEWKAVFDVALSSAEACGDRRGQAGILSGLGVLHGVAREEPEAIRYLERVLAIQREIGDREGEARVQYNLSMAYHNTDEAHRSLEHGREAIRLARELGVSTLEADSLQAMADTNTYLGRHATALGLVDAALDIWQRIGLADSQPFLVHSRGRALLGLGRREEGIACVLQSIEMFTARGELYEAGDVLAQLGTIHLHFGDREQARAYWLRAVHVLTETGHPFAEEVRAKLAGLVGTDLPTR
ncbi:AfsR/SARP family transcriptional regulator [Amycolatopsis albispora]|nr:AfsR/SARP family transcriptional regulator [Amycolatopsis albispora]